jgi:hypothetical protein
MRMGIVVLVNYRSSLADHISVGPIDEGREIKDDTTSRRIAFDRM